MKKKTIKVLFLGQKDCEFSYRAYSYLLDIGCKVTIISSDKRGEKFPNKFLSWEGDYIFCFRSYYILPASLLKKAKIAAINFHPATPQYPGSGSLNWALYDNCSEYGVTAHLINDKVDNGRILKVKKFKILENDNVNSLSKRTSVHALALFYEVIEELFNMKHILTDSNFYNAQEQWNGRARKINEINNMSIINKNITSDELNRRIRAFHTEKYPLSVIINGKKFVLNLENKTEK